MMTDMHRTETREDELQVILFVDFQLFIRIPFQMNGNRWYTKNGSLDMDQSVTYFTVVFLEKRRNHSNERTMATHSKEHTASQC